MRIPWWTTAETSQDEADPIAVLAGWLTAALAEAADEHAAVPEAPKVADAEALQTDEPATVARAPWRTAADAVAADELAAVADAA